MLLQKKRSGRKKHFFCEFYVQLNIHTLFNIINECNKGSQPEKLSVSFKLNSTNTLKSLMFEVICHKRYNNNLNLRGENLLGQLFCSNIYNEDCS